MAGHWKKIVTSSDAEYRIEDRNCIDFIASVASRLGYPQPERSLLQTPTDFMAAFKPLASQELKVREAAREAAEMKKRASTAKANAQQSEIARQKAEQRATRAEKEAADLRAEQARIQSETIPAGWIACTCPQVHSAFGIGKWVRGVLYHPSNLNCPK